jgi:hypothetical protein
MRNIKQEVDSLAKRYLIIIIGFTVILSAIQWYLIDQKIEFDKNSLFMSIPLFFGWIPMILFYRPEMKRINSNIIDKKSKYKIWTPIGTFVIVTIIFQYYLFSFFHTIPEFENIDKVEHAEYEYIKLKNYYIDRKSYSADTESFVSSPRGGKRINYYLYLTFPIFCNEKDTSKKEATAWMGVRYYDDISISATDSEKLVLLNEVLRRGYSDIPNIDLTHLDYFEFPKNDIYNEAVYHSKRYYNNSDSSLAPTVYKGFQGSLTNNSWGTLFWALGILIFGVLNILLSGRVEAITTPKVE